MTKCKVKINKEIRDYTEAIFFGLSLRQFIFSVLACGVLCSWCSFLRTGLCLSAFDTLHATLHGSDNACQ